MEKILNHLVTYQSIYLVGLLFILVVLLFLVVLTRKQKKVKPIELEEITKDEPKSELEDVIAALENSQNSELPMTTFEQEQEENAIISYQELVAAVQDKKSKVEEKEAKEKAEPIEEIIEEVEEIVQEEPIRKFKNSEVISPVFGKANQTSDDFLKELKDFRKSL